ncbi:uncharacterized protein LOC134821472 isoform X3 [Bolinopsis microptera]|uniref:uncharacterized protein LOC134821472 isoform X3 n=1 Tax=Bolinopsis microptera TaxID=2820187 RepID=UPI003079347D
MRCQNKKVIKRKPRPQWNGSINDVESMKLSKSEVEKRTKLYSAKHMEKIRNEIKAMQRKEKSLQSAIHSSPFVAHNRSIVVQEATDTKSKLQELLNETDRKMAEAKDMFGDHGYKYRVIPNVTSAPRFNHSPITLARTMVDESSSPPTALNDTQKLGVVTVETLPPETSTLDLTRIRQLLNQEKENCVLTAQNTLINSNLVNTATAVKINKVLDFNEDIPSVRMADRSRRKVRIGDTQKAAAAGEAEARDHWSPVPVEVNTNHVVMSSKPEKSNSFEASPPRLRESSSESLVSPSRIKKQQSLKKRSPKSDGGSDSKDDKTKTKKRTPEKKPTSPVQIVSKSAPPPHSATSPNSAPPADSAPKLGDSFTEHRYPSLLKVPAIKEDEDSPIDNGAEEVDPIRASRSPSGRKISPRNNLVNMATSPVPTPRPVSTHSMATSPVRALQGPVKGLAIEKKEGHHSYDRQYTDQELKDRLESLIVGGHYPFARVEQKSYAIADPDGNKEDKETDKQVGTWIRANFPSEGENLTFEDSSPLKGAALDLELKLRKYQSQIGDKPNKKNAPMGGFSGYTSLLLRSVSTMIGYLTEQEGNTLDERGMRSEVIETMSALQNTVETLSTELLSCRKDLSETKQKVQVMEQDYSSTLMFLIDNCVLKDPSLQTPLRAERIEPLPTVISPFTKSPPQPPPDTTPDLLTFTPHPNKSENLMEFTPGQADGQTAQTDSLVQITPETSEQYLQYLEEKTEALRSGLDDKINKMNKREDRSVDRGADRSADRSADKSFVSIESESPEKPEIIDNEKNSLLAQNKSNLSCMNFSNLTEDGLDLSQDLDALINRLKQMNAQTLAVTSQQMGLTPRKADADVIESVKNIKDLLDVEQTKPQEAATRVIESYNRQSDFSPSQLLPDVQESTPNSDSKHSKRSNELSAQSLHPAEVSPIFISPPDVNSASSGRISGEYIGSFSGTEPVAVRPLTPNPLSPRRVEEEIRRSTPDCKISGTPPNETHSVSSSPPGSPSNCLDVSFSDTSPTICRSYSSILQSPSAFSPPTKEGNEPSSTESSPKHDKTAMINDFLSHNPHYLKKISESLTSASLPSFPTSPTQVSTARLTKDDGVPNETEKSPFVKPTGGSPGVPEAVIRGSVFKNIAKFEKKLEEAELERERSISPKRSPTRRGKGSIKRATRSALSPERKPNSPKVKHRVSWEGDLNDQDSPPPKNNIKPTKGVEQQEEESEIVMKPDRSLLPERRIPEKTKDERRVTKKTVNGRKSPEENTNGRAPEKAVQGKRAPEKKKVANGSHPKNGSTPSAADPKGKKDTPPPPQKQEGDVKSTGNREPKLSSQSSGIRDIKMIILTSR